MKPLFHNCSLIAIAALHWVVAPPEFLLIKRSGNIRYLKQYSQRYFSSLKLNALVVHPLKLASGDLP